MRLQATITTHWLQIARNSLPNDPSTGCLVSIFTVRINLFPLDCTLRTRMLPTQTFGNVRRLILRIQATAVLMRLSERYIEEKQTELENENM